MIKLGKQTDFIPFYELAKNIASGNLDLDPEVFVSLAEFGYELARLADHEISYAKKRKILMNHKLAELLVRVQYWLETQNADPEDSDDDDGVDDDDD